MDEKDEKNPKPGQCILYTLIAIPLTGIALLVATAIMNYSFDFKNLDHIASKISAGLTGDACKILLNPCENGGTCLNAPNSTTGEPFSFTIQSGQMHLTAESHVELNSSTQ